MDPIIKNFRKKLADNDFVYGIFSKTQDPMNVEIQGISGYDFIILDCEHGPSTLSDEQNNIRAALLRGMLPIIRVSELSENAIGKAFDIGALGVEVPQITNADDARKAVKFSRFYPYGERGVCRFVRAANYSALDRNEYFNSSKDLLVILQLEGIEAIKNIDEILTVDGVDIIFIGPYDLSQSLGVPGDIKNPIVLNEMIKIVDKAKSKNKIVGTFTDDYEMVQKWKSLGVQYISYSTDAGLFYEKTRDTLHDLQICGLKESKAMILDCTLRDGGYCNNWQFGIKNIKSIIEALEISNVDFIECGYLNNKEYLNGSTKFISLDVINKIIDKKSKKNYTIMINYGDYPIEFIPNYCGNGINTIRVSFHKKDMIEALTYCGNLVKKGYKVFVQAMVTTNYSDKEYELLIKKCNEFNPYAVYIVDSFGVMKRREVLHYYKILERLLTDTIYPGFHSHNNMQLAFSNVISLLDIAKRKIIIDSSIYGMGRGAGNLNTELLIEYLNDNYAGKYQLDPVLGIIDNVLNKIHNKFYWGYSLPNYLSAKYNAHPKYAMYLSEKNNLTYKDINNIFSMLDVDHKFEFDKKYIEEIYLSYLESKEINNNDMEKLKKVFEGKDVIVIAPGKSSLRNKEIINSSNSIKVSVNFHPDYLAIDYIFIGNIRRMNELNKNLYNRVIATSNIPQNNIYAKVRYSDLLNKEEFVNDNSGLMLLQLLINLNVNSVRVFGMDGYVYNSDENYANNELELLNSKESIDRLNFGLNIMKKRFSEIYNIVFIK